MRWPTHVRRLIPLAVLVPIVCLALIVRGYAHDRTATSEPASPSAMVAVDEHGPQHDDVVEAEATQADESPPWSWAAAAILFASGAGLVLARRYSVRLAVGGLLVGSGAIHGLLAPGHWQQGWHLGAFFVVAALVLFGLAFSVTATRRHGYWVGLGVLAILIGLYFASRQVALPGVGHVESYDAVGLMTKLAEAGAIVGYALLLRHAKSGRSQATMGNDGAGHGN